MTQQHPQWPPVPPPQQPPASSGRLVASIIAGGILGMVAGAFVAVLLEAAVAGDSQAPGIPVLLMLVLAPAGGLLGALWGMRQGRRLRRPRPPVDPSRYPNRVIRRDKRS